MELTKQLDRKRATLKACMTRLESFLAIEGTTPREITLRFERLSTLMNDYEEMRDAEGGDTGESDDFNRWEDRYYAILLKATPNKPPTNVNANKTLPTTSRNSGTTSTTEHARLTRLPDIAIPKFGGDLEAWIAYKDSFLSMIGERLDFSEIEKLTYLKSSLTGMAHKVVESYHNKASNYKVAWEALLEAYDRPRMLITKILDAMLRDQKPKAGDRNGLVQLLNDFRARVNALISLNVTPNPIITHLVARQMPDEYPIEWIFLSPDVYPPVEDLYKYLIEKIFQLPTVRNPPSQTRSRSEHAERKTNVNLRNKRKGYDSRSQSPRNRRNPPRAHAFVTASSRECLICRDRNHSLCQYPQYIAMSTETRWGTIAKHKICANCLRAHSDGCQAGRCRVCKKMHHTTLHIYKNDVATKTKETKKYAVGTTSE
ncbi:hypothetical protein M0802_011320 [Mischocyttarus mexicanus]|nr:hypothetical protein M0802_011320 [Mischocyttarus mexicanus]